MLKRGTVEYYEVVREDADGFAYSAHRLSGYMGSMPWWRRWTAAFVVGWLRAFATGLRLLCDREDK